MVFFKYVIQLSARQHRHCSVYCLNIFPFFFFSSWQVEISLLSLALSDRNAFHQVITVKDLLDNNNMTSFSNVCVYIYYLGRCLFGRGRIGFPWRLVRSICSRSMRSVSQTFLSRTVWPEMGLYPSNDWSGRRFGPCRLGIYPRSPSCEIVITSTLSHHLQRYI